MSKRARDPKSKRNPPKGSRIIRSGQCKRCGKCCCMDSHGDEYRKMELKTFDARLEKAIADGHSEPYPLDPICAHLMKLRDGTFICGIYPNRPMGCKKWPTHPNQLRNIPGCGYTLKILTKQPSTKAERMEERSLLQLPAVKVLAEGPGE